MNSRRGKEWCAAYFRNSKSSIKAKDGVSVRL